MQPPWDIVLWEAATARERRRLQGVELGPRPCLAFSPGWAPPRNGGPGARCSDLGPGDGPAGRAPPVDCDAVDGVSVQPGRPRAWPWRASMTASACTTPSWATSCCNCAVSGSPPTGSYGFIARVVFSPDGNRLAANGWDGKVTIWTASANGVESLSQR